MKIKLQNLASFIISKLTGLNLLDVTTGFRAYSKDYAKELNVFTNYTYTLETIISAAFTKKRITTIKISTNSYSRESRLIKSNGVYILKSIYTVFRVLVLYRPIRVFSIISSFIFLISILSFFLISNFNFSFLLFGLGFHIFCIGLIIDAIRVYNTKKNYGITEQ
jgi:hypothetical protein